MGIEHHIANLSVLAAATARNPDARRRSRQVIHIMPVRWPRLEVQELVRIAAIDVNDIKIGSVALDQEWIFLQSTD